MDVTCANCGEPWDSYYLLFDVVWEWDLPDALARDFNRNPRFDGPSDPVRCAAQRAGWKFVGSSPVAILRCPSCAGSAPLGDAHERQAMTRIAAQLLDGDADGLIAELADR
jgi:hypothetical protein